MDAPDFIPSKRSKTEAETCSPTAIWSQPTVSTATTTTTEHTPIHTKQVHIAIWPEPMHTITMPFAGTVKQLLEGEANFHNIPTSFPFRAFDILGRPLPDDGTIRVNDIVVITPHDFTYDLNVAAIALPFDEAQRSRFLWHQGGFVAQDEMRFYLSQLQAKGKIVLSHPMLVHSYADLGDQLMEWLLQSIEIHQQTNQHSCCLSFHGTLDSNSH